MKKCSFCGLENPDEAGKCRQCETALAAPGAGLPPEDAGWSRRVLPYFLSYFLITSAVFLYDFIAGQRKGTPMPEHYLILNTSYPINDLIDKLAKVGVPKDSIGGVALPPDVGTALFHHFALFGVVLFAFWALTKLFQRFLKR